MNDSPASVLFDINGNAVGVPANPITVSGVFWPAFQPVSGTITATQSTGSNLHTILDSGIITSITNPVTVSGVFSLPSNASTAALQTTGNSYLSAISANTPATGQALMANSIPVTIASNQSALTVSGSFWQGIQPVSGTITAAQSTAANLNATVVQGSGGTSAWKTDGSAVTQPVSASALPLPSGASTSAKQPALGTAGTPSSDVLSVQGVSSMTALKVDGSAVTQPVSASALPLPSGASTAAKQPALGTAGTPASDVLTVQGNASGTPIPISGTVSLSVESIEIGKVDQGTGGTSAWKVDGSAVTQPVSVTALPLPTGAATESTLGAVSAKLAALGQKAMTGSMPVVIASDQGSIPVIPGDRSDSGVLNYAGGIVAANTIGCGSVTFNVMGTWSGSFVIEGSNDGIVGSNWVPLQAYSLATGAFISTVTSNAMLVVACSGMTLIRMRCTVYTSGTITIIWDSSGASAPLTSATVIGTLPLPTGAATDTTLSAMSAKIPTLGQKTMANSQPCVLASDQSAVNVNGTVTANIGTTNGLALDATLTGGSQKATVRGGAKGTTAAADVTSEVVDANTQALHVHIAGVSDTMPVSATALPLPTGAATSSNLTTLGSQTTKINDGTNTVAVKASSAAAAATDPALVVAISPNNSVAVIQGTPSNLNAAVVGTGSAGTPATGVVTIQGIASGTAVPCSMSQIPASVGQKTMANSEPVCIASDQGTLSTKETVSSTASCTNVAAAVADTSLLAANTNRLGAIIYNDSTATMYMKFGSGASITSFTYKLPAQATFEMGMQRYVGAINCYWSAATGNARITELTA